MPTPRSVIVDREFARTMKDALAHTKVKPLVIDYDDPEFSGAGERIGSIEYEDFLNEGDPDYAWAMPGDEWNAISLNYPVGHHGAIPRRGLSSSRRFPAAAATW